jgi:HEAT repeat protein
MGEYDATLFDALTNLDDEQLQFDYFNRLDQTEAIAQTLPHLPPELALHIIRLALEVDLGLGSKLAGYVPSQAQSQAVQMILDLGLSKVLTVELLAEMRSSATLPFFIPILHNDRTYFEAFCTDYDIDLAELEPDPRLVEQGLFHCEHSTIHNHRHLVRDAILQIEHPDAIQALRVVLFSESESSSRSASCTSRNLGVYRNTTTTQLMLELIQASPEWISEHEETYYTVASELAERGYHVVIPILMNALANCSDDWMIGEAMSGLAKLGVMEAVEAITAFFAGDENDTSEEDILNRKRSSYLRSYALDALSKLGGAIAEEIIRHSLCDDSLWVSSHSIASTYRSLWGTKKAIIEVGQCLVGDDISIRKQALEVLGSLVKEDTPCRTMSAGEIKDGIFALDMLVQCLNNIELDMRTLAAQLLTDLIKESRDYVESRYGTLLYPDFNPRPSWSCLEALDRERILNTLIEGLAEGKDDLNHKKWIVRALVYLENPKAQPALLKMSQQNNMPEIRGYAAKALASFKSFDSLPILLNMLSQETDEEIRFEIISGLSFYLELSPIPSGLIDLFLSLAHGRPMEGYETSRELRRLAIAMLDKIGGSEAMEALEKAVAPEEPERLFLAPTALDSLSRIATAQAVSVLVRCFQEASDNTVPLFELGGYDAENLMEALAKTGEKEAFDTILKPLPYGHYWDSHAEEVMGGYGTMEHIPRLWEIRNHHQRTGYGRSIAHIQERAGYYNLSFCCH